MTPNEPTVLTERRENLFIITINRPHVRNAVDQDTAALLECAMDEFDETDDLFVGIVTGAGGTFSAGADLKAAQTGRFGAVGRRGGFGTFKIPPRKPLIAAVEGFAVGGGFEMCLASDLIVAARTARFGLPEVRHNVLAAGGGLFRLPRRIPYHLAMELALTGDLRDAEFFERWGLINRLVDEGGALDAAIALAGSIVRNGPLAVAASKQIIGDSASWATEAQAWEEQAPRVQRVLDSEDRHEGLRAFAEKRMPVWKGR